MTKYPLTRRPELHTTAAGLVNWKPLRPTAGSVPSLSPPGSLQLQPGHGAGDGQRVPSEPAPTFGCTTGLVRP